MGRIVSIVSWILLLAIVGTNAEGVHQRDVFVAEEKIKALKEAYIECAKSNRIYMPIALKCECKK